MTTSRRSSLAHFKIDDFMGTNIALWLDKYIGDCRKKSAEAEENTSKMTLVQQAGQVQVPADYFHAISLREDEWSVDLLNDRVDLLEVIFEQRVVVGLGQSGVLETGITLDHTWGLPKLPGSSIKGVAAAAAHLLAEGDEWKKTGGADGSDTAKGVYHAALFGDLEEAGLVSFLDGWWRPMSKGDRPLHPDIMTPHQQQYYMDGKAPPNDLTSPIPVPFLTTTGVFVIPILGPRQWRDLAIQLLAKGLAELGIGAKTAKGYGHGIVNLKKLEEDRRDWEGKRSVVTAKQRAIDSLKLCFDSNFRSQFDRGLIPIWESRQGMDLVLDLALFEGLFTQEQLTPSEWIEKLLSNISQRYHRFDLLSEWMSVERDSEAAQQNLLFKWNQLGIKERLNGQVSTLELFDVKPSVAQPQPPSEEVTLEGYKAIKTNAGKTEWVQAHRDEYISMSPEHKARFLIAARGLKDKQKKSDKAAYKKWLKETEKLLKS